MPLEKANAETAQSLDVNQLIDRSGTGVKSGCLPVINPTFPRRMNVGSGVIRIDDTRVSFGGGEVTIPDPPDPDPSADHPPARIDVVIVTPDGSLTVASGTAEPMSAPFTSVDSFTELTAPDPPSTLPEACPIASVISRAGVTAIDNNEWEDRRLPPDTDAPITPAPGQVAATLEALPDGTTINLDPEFDYGSGGDFPWPLRDKSLQGNGTVIDLPDDVPCAIQFLPLDEGEISDLTIQVSPSHQGGEIIRTDIPRDWPDMQGLAQDATHDDSTKYYGEISTYSRRRVMHNVSVVGPSLAYLQQNDKPPVPNCAGLYIHESGTGLGVTEYDISTQGLDRGIHLHSEGMQDSSSEVHGNGFLNGDWFFGSHTFDRVMVRLESEGGTGINSNHFYGRFQPTNNVTEHYVHATLTDPGSPHDPEISENVFVCDLWDPNKLGSFAGEALLYDGPNISGNTVRTTTQVNNYVDSTDGDCLTERNGASGNGIVREATLLNLKEQDSNSGIKFGTRLNSPNNIDAADVSPREMFWGANDYHQTLYVNYNQYDANNNNTPRKARVNPRLRKKSANNAPLSTDGSGAHEVIRVDTDPGPATLTISSGDEIRNCQKTIACDGANTLTIDSSSGAALLDRSEIKLSKGQTADLYFVPNYNTWEGTRTAPFVAAEGTVTLSSGSATVDTGVSADTNRFYNVNVSPQGAGDVAASLEHNGSTYTVHVEENTTSNNPTVAYQLEEKR